MDATVQSLPVVLVPTVFTPNPTKADSAWIKTLVMNDMEQTGICSAWLA